MDLALIHVWPFRTSADEDASLVLPPDDYGFFSNDIGGVVRGELNITEREQPYIVRRSIYVDGYVLRQNTVQLRLYILFVSPSKTLCSVRENYHVACPAFTLHCSRLFAVEAEC